MMETYADTLARLAGEDERIVVLTAENRIHIKTLPEKLKDRFIDVGICEQTLVGVAAGLAMKGKIPFVHGIAAFVTMRAFEFIRTDVGIPRLSVKIVGSFPGFLSEGNGPTHQAIEDLALMRLVPNMVALSPSDEEDLLSATAAAANHEGPVYIRCTNVSPGSIKHQTPFVIGKSETLREGSDAAILVHGLLTNNAFLAAQILAREGISVRVVNMRSLQPFDEEVIVRAAGETRMVLTVEDHIRTGGLSSIVCETIAKYQITAKVASMPVNQSGFHPGPLANIFEQEGFTAEAIAHRIKRELSARELQAGINHRMKKN